MKVISYLLVMIPTTSSFLVLPGNTNTISICHKTFTRCNTINSPLQMSESDSEFSGMELVTGQLTSTLARMESNWKQQRKPNDWVKLYVDLSERQDDDDESEEEKPAPSTSDFVYLLQPANGASVPSSVIVFVGGAGLGQYPHIAYSEMLRRLSEKTGAAILAAPYEVKLDHFDLAKRTGELLRKGVLECREVFGWAESLPQISLSHSLGSKLQLINMAATGSGEGYSGIGLISFNNFGLADSVGMARSFLSQIQQGEGPVSTGFGGDGLFDTVFEFATTALKGIGIEFSPSPEKMEQLIGMKFSSELQDKSRLFCFDDDNLDCSSSLVESCEEKSSGGPNVSALPGTHLTPVYLKLGYDDLPEETRGMAGQFLDAKQSFSFGDDASINALVDEVYDWIVGKAPAREPAWKTKSPYEYIIGGSVDDKVN